MHDQLPPPMTLRTNWTMMRDTSITRERYLALTATATRPLHDGGMVFHRPMHDTGL